MSLTNTHVKVSVNDSDKNILADNTAQVTTAASLKKAPLDSSQSASLWLLWPRLWLLVQDPIGAKDNLDTCSDSWHGLAEAKQIIESSSDPYHYACSWIFSGKTDPSDSVELAVYNTLSCNLPLRISRSEIPMNSKAAQEKALLLALLSQSIAFPSLADYLRCKSLTTLSRLALQNSIPSLLYNMAETYRERHLYRSLSRSRAIRSSRSRSVIVIAFHSWLPTKFARAANLGSSGSSTDMASLVAILARQWLRKNSSDIESDEHSIRIISLEGFGRLAQRTEALLKLLANWRTEINDSDTVLLIATSHSIGVGLEVMLLLVEQQNITSNQRHKRIAFISLGGAALGPVAGIDARVVRRAYTALEYDIISDMIDLARHSSEQARRMDISVQTLLARPSVRLIFCAAVDDLLVPLVSALATQYHHPRLLRYLYGNRHPGTATPEFVLLLLEIIVILKNVGWRTDYGVLQELSDRCSASDVIGAAASMVNDPCVFDEAIRITMETTSLVCDCRHELVVSRVTSPSAPAVPGLPSDTPFAWRLRCLLERLTLVSNIHNARLIRRVVGEYRRWISAFFGARLFRDAHMLFGALADICAEDLLV